MPDHGDIRGQVPDDPVNVLEGSTFMISDRRGDVARGSAAGLFHEDTRYISEYRLTIDGAKPQVLTSDQVDYYSAGFFMTNPPLDGVPQGALSIKRHRFVGEGLHDDLTLLNHTADPVTVSVRLRFGVDFADLFEVKQKRFRKKGIASTHHDVAATRLHFAYEHATFRAATRIDFSATGRLEGDDVVFDVSLAPQGTWKTCVSVRLSLNDRMRDPKHRKEVFAATEREASLVLEKWRDAVPWVRADNDLIELVFRKSLVDLAALRLHFRAEGREAYLPAAGLPWFMAIFGRDTLVTAYQSLWVGPDLARGALLALGALQGRVQDDFKDEEPGKILHEIRRGELTALRIKPHSPYYGSCDSTPLWLILLSEYWRFTDDDDAVRLAEPTALRALEWIDDYGDRDGDGYVEYQTRSSQGLGNQGWKDSWDSVKFHDGRLAQTPIALCEIQGYVYDAKLRMAELAERVWNEPQLAQKLRSQAQDLFDRFNRDYWIGERGGFYAMALDGDKKKVDSMTSNMGHLLWSGILPEDRAAKVAKQLMSPRMFSGWGVRTMSINDTGYNPIAYHDGTVWPHDNSIIAAGLARYGFREEANRIAMALFEAAAFTEYRLPEVFAGYDRQETGFPVRYPTACSPQAWATAAPFLWLRVMTGIDVRDGVVHSHPAVPDEVGELFLHGIHALGSHFDVRARGTDGEVTVTS